MQCIKTGCHAYSEEYNEYLYGDAHEIEVGGDFGHFYSITIFRICERSFAPLGPRLHFTIHSIDRWFDEANSKVRDSTLIATAATNHGYEGKEI